MRRIALWPLLLDSNLDALKPAPPMDTVRFESEPPGAEARVSNGQTCRTPCALALPRTLPYNVTFTLNGYLPGAETLEVASIGDDTSSCGRTRWWCELAPAPPPPKPQEGRSARGPPPNRSRKRRKQAAPPAPEPAAPPAAAPRRRRPSAAVALAARRSADARRSQARFVACRRATARWTARSFSARLPI